jgi:hypothetical protein
VKAKPGSRPRDVQAPQGQKFVPSCGDARRPSTTAACLSSLTVRPRAMSGLSRSWCSSASTSPFAVSCGRGVDLALAAPPRPPEGIVVTRRVTLRALAARDSYVGRLAATERWTMAAVACEPAGRPSSSCARRSDTRSSSRACLVGYSHCWAPRRERGAERALD